MEPRSSGRDVAAQCSAEGGTATANPAPPHGLGPRVSHNHLVICGPWPLKTFVATAPLPPPPQPAGFTTTSNCGIYWLGKGVRLKEGSRCCRGRAVGSAPFHLPCWESPTDPCRKRECLWPSEHLRKLPGRPAGPMLSPRGCSPRACPGQTFQQLADSNHPTA